VANRASEEVSVIDAIRDEVINTLRNVGARPAGLSISGDILYVTESIPSPGLHATDGFDGLNVSRATLISHLTHTVAGTTMLYAAPDSSFRTDFSLADPSAPGSLLGSASPVGRSERSSRTYVPSNASRGEGVGFEGLSSETQSNLGATTTPLGSSLTPFGNSEDSRPLYSETLAQLGSLGSKPLPLGQNQPLLGFEQTPGAGTIAVHVLDRPSGLDVPDITTSPESQSVSDLGDPRAELGLATVGPPTGFNLVKGERRNTEQRTYSVQERPKQVTVHVPLAPPWEPSVSYVRLPPASQLESKPEVENQGKAPSPPSINQGGPPTSLPANSNAGQGGPFKAPQRSSVPEGATWAAGLCAAGLFFSRFLLRSRERGLA
jgi:hypothetical protein